MGQDDADIALGRFGEVVLLSQVHPMFMLTSTITITIQVLHSILITLLAHILLPDACVGVKDMASRKLYLCIIAQYPDNTQYGKKECQLIVTELCLMLGLLFWGLVHYVLEL